MSVRRPIAVFMFCAAYPLFVLALWIGARDQNWVAATALVTGGLLMSFLGWGLLCPMGGASDAHSMKDCEDRDDAVSVFLALYNRTGAVVVLLGSYAIVARTLGWRAPESFSGWFVLAWVPLFAMFALPVEIESSSAETIH